MGRGDGGGEQGGTGVRWGRKEGWGSEVRREGTDGSWDRSGDREIDFINCCDVSIASGWG